MVLRTIWLESQWLSPPVFIAPGNGGTAGEPGMDNVPITDPAALRAELAARIESARGPVGPLNRFQLEEMMYAFTRPIAGHMLANYDGVLKIDGEVGNKKFYDPRSYLKKAEASMTERIIEACNDLHSSGRSVSA